MVAISNESVPEMAIATGKWEYIIPPTSNQPKTGLDHYLPPDMAVAYLHSLHSLLTFLVPLLVFRYIGGMGLTSIVSALMLSHMYTIWLCTTVFAHK